MLTPLEFALALISFTALGIAHLVLSYERNKIMATAAQALQDLDNAVTALGTAVTAATAELSALLTLIGTPGVAPADVETAVANAQTLITNLNAAVAAAQQTQGGAAPAVKTAASSKATS